MSDLSFEWDEEKNRINQRKHGVAFEEAQTVFFDDHAVEFCDDTLGLGGPVPDSRPKCGSADFDGVLL